MEIKLIAKLLLVKTQAKRRAFFEFSYLKKNPRT